MDKSLNREMFNKCESRKVCVAGYQRDNSDFDFCIAEHNELPEIKICSDEGLKRRLSTIETKRDSGFFWNHCDKASEWRTLLVYTAKNLTSFRSYELIKNSNRIDIWQEVKVYKQLFIEFFFLAVKNKKIK